MPEGPFTEVVNRANPWSWHPLARPERCVFSQLVSGNIEHKLHWGRDEKEQGAGRRGAILAGEGLTSYLGARPGSPVRLHFGSLSTAECLLELEQSGPPLAVLSGVLSEPARALQELLPSLLLSPTMGTFSSHPTNTSYNHPENVCQSGR